MLLLLLLLMLEWPFIPAKRRGKGLMSGKGGLCYENIRQSDLILMLGVKSHLQSILVKVLME